MIFFVSRVFAAPAYPGEIAIAQPDGSSILVRQIGDESFHQVLHEGYPILKDTKGWWKYVVPTKEGIEIGSNIVGVDAVPEYDRRIFETYRPEEVFEYEETEITIGRLRYPVILINFNDTEITFDNESIAVGMMEKVRDYYFEISEGQLELEFEVVGWYTAAEDHDYYGYDLWRKGNDAHPQELVAEAVEASDPFIDFSRFDNDGNGSVDNVIVIHQGTGQEMSGEATDIWSHSWSINSVQKDGVWISSYTIQPELIDNDEIATIGVLCHELGHALGLPDLYDTDSSSWAVGDWGLMAHGTWNYLNRPGDSPAHMTGWSKKKLGWLEPVALNNFAGNLQISPVEENGNVYIYENPERPGIEYFLLENRQQIGYDSALPGEGLLIYHVDESSSQNNDSHRKVDIEEADNDCSLDATDTADRGSTGDPYPGVTINKEFSSTSYPSSDFYNGFSQLKISDITEFNGNIILKAYTENYSPFSSSYILVGNREIFAHTSGDEIKDYQILDSEGVLISDFSDYDSIIIELEAVARRFDLAIDITYTDESTDTVTAQFFPFSYIIVSDGITEDKLVYIREFGWDEIPDLWTGEDSIYWKWYEDDSISVFGYELK